MKCPSGICYRRSEAGAKTAYPPQTDAAVDDEAKKRFEAYQRAKYNRVLLRWDRKRGSFSVHKRFGTEKRTLEEFKAACGQWSPVC